MAQRRTTKRRRGRRQQPETLPTRRLAVAYARVSSKDQEREGFSIPAQQRLLNNYAAENGIDIVEEYVDVETAKRTGRTNYVKMLAWLKRNRKTCNIILVEKTDRLYRNLKDWVDLDDMDLEIHLVKEGTILSREARSSEKFMHGIRVLMAKNYIDNLSEEATKGMAEKAEQGIWPSKAPLGYKNVARDDGKKVMVVDPDKAPMVTRLFEWAATGNYSLEDLTGMADEAGLRMRKSGNKINKSGIHRILHNPIYMGDIVWHDEVFDGIHAPLVSRDMWERVQAILDGRYQNQRGKERKNEFAFTGLINCGHCGCALSAEIKKQRYVYYHCTGAKGRCDEPYVREEVLGNHFADHLRRLYFDDEVMGWLKKALRESHADQEKYHREAIQRLETDCARLQRRIDQAYLDKLDGVIDGDYFDRMSAQWREEQRKHRQSIIKHENANQAYIEEGIMLLEVGREAAELFAIQEPGEKRRLLNFMVQNCQWSNGTLAIEWRQPFDIMMEFSQAIKEEPPSGSSSEGGPSRLVTPRGFEFLGNLFKINKISQNRGLRTSWNPVSPEWGRFRGMSL